MGNFSSNWSATLGPLQGSLSHALEQMAQTRLIPRLWAKDHTLWNPEPREIVNRLGWLTVAEHMRGQVPSLDAFARSVSEAGIRHVVLLGMGGSSLGPEVLRMTFKATSGFPRFWVLDSTLPGAVQAVTKAIQPAKTLFLVASKSGGTIEVLSLFSHFWSLVKRTRGNKGGAQFVAITDPGTSLTALAQERGFRTTFLNQPDIGGRYSVLSYFGLVPAALLGLKVEQLLSRALDMAMMCGDRVPPEQNPGACLGAVMGLAGRAGQDKLTVVTSPQITAFGLWVEQLVAESTGKGGKGLVPIADEPLEAPVCYGHDRLFIYVRLEGDAKAALDRGVAALEQAGHPVVRLILRDRYDLGAEFFRWEFATAVAGHFLGIHPFDQPNVQESKSATARILSQMRTSRRFTLPEPGRLTELWERARPGRYVALLAYLTPNARTDVALKRFRQKVLRRLKLPTTVGYGPRYLHSTGQLHKGGPNTGLFIQLTEPARRDVKIPGQAYTFGALASAQAAGDLEALRARDRPAIRVDIGARSQMAIAALTRSVGVPVATRRAGTSPRGRKGPRHRRRTPAQKK